MVASSAHLLLVPERGDLVSAQLVRSSVASGVRGPPIRLAPHQEGLGQVRRQERPRVILVAEQPAGLGLANRGNLENDESSGGAWSWPEEEVGSFCLP